MARDQASVEALEGVRQFIDAAEQAIRTTSSAHAAWTIVEGRHEEYRSLAVGEALREPIERRLHQAPPSDSDRPAKRPIVDRQASIATPTVLTRIDSSKRFDKQ